MSEMALEAPQMPPIPQIQPVGSSLDTGRSTCSTTRSEYGRDPNRRVAPLLSLEQEEALLGLMFDNWQQHNCQTLNYDHVMRCALTLQCNPAVCTQIGATAVHIDKAWRPDDGWITDMCFAFNDADSQLTARSKPAGEITPGGITTMIMSEIGMPAVESTAPSGGAMLPPHPGPMLAGPMGMGGGEVLIGAPSGGGKKGKKKKDKSHNLSDAELLADPRRKKQSKRAPSPKSARKGKSSARSVHTDR